jgi:multidrug efflux pump subunit AcrA (membrane-fusion protein)
MWMKDLGRSKWVVTVLAGWTMAFLCWGGPELGYAQEAPVTKSPPAPSPGESEIIFNGKLFCSLKRRVDLPFKGVITSLRVHSGQHVEAGDILATYHLAPEARLAIEQRLSPPQIFEMESRLAGLERGLLPQRSKQQELSQLVPKQLAPPQSLEQTNQELQLMENDKRALQERLQDVRQMARQDREVLSQLLGVSLKSGRVPQEVALKAPISGYIIGVNPEMRVDADLPPMPAAFQIGVMNPMLVRAQAFEIEALQIKVGDRAEVTLESLPGRKFPAEVSRISWSSTTTAGIEQPAYYEVELTVPNPDLTLKEGLKARIVLRKSK